MEEARKCLQGLEGERLEQEKARLFEMFRKKNAALSHVDNPRSDLFQLDEDTRGPNRPGPPPVLLRLDVRPEDYIPDGERFPARDKSNIITDHAEKYLLSRPDTAPDIPPSDELLPTDHTRKVILYENKRVTPDDHWQDVRHLTFILELESDEDEFAMVQPGSTMTIYPKNYPMDVQKLLDLMEWTDIADLEIEWKSAMTAIRDLQGPPTDNDKLRGLGFCPPKLRPLNNSTLRQLFIHNLDFTAVPTRGFLKQLIQFTNDEREKERLKELSSTVGSDAQEFYDYTSRPRRTILEVLDDFPGVKIPVQYILELFPLIRGREFSIANGGKSLYEESDSTILNIELLVALVEYKTIIRKPRQGLCSRYLKHLIPGTEMAVSFKDGNSPPPQGIKNAERPLLAIATGTGIAPIRSLIYERHEYEEVGDEYLFFGCRNRKADFYFAGEWEDLGVKVFPAFSRDPDALDPITFENYGSPSTLPSSITGVYGAAQAPPLDTVSTGLRTFDYDKGKMYVQHLIRKHAELVCELVTKKAIVVLCGNSGRMPASVRRALLDAFQIGKLASSSMEAETIFEKMDFWQETW